MIIDATEAEKKVALKYEKEVREEIKGMLHAAGIYSESLANFGAKCWSAGYIQRMRDGEERDG